MPRLVRDVEDDVVELAISRRREDGKALDLVVAGGLKVFWCCGGRTQVDWLLEDLERVGEDRISGSLGKRGFREKKEAAEALGGGRRGAEIFLKTIHGWRLFSHRQAWRVAQSHST